MYAVEKLQSALDALNRKRSQIAGVGWYLQHCWLVQVKPGGNARTDRKYWQVRSRLAMFDGKTLRHLKPDEVEDYRAAIDRGRQLKQVDRQITKLQQQLEKLIATTDSSGSLSTQILHHPPSPPYQGGNKSQKLASPLTNRSFSEEGLRGVNNDSGARFESTPQETPLQNPILSTESLQESLEEQSQSKVRFTDVAEQERLVKELLVNSQELRISLRNSATVSKLLRAGSVNLRNGHPRPH
jgi:hypothetical protein